MRRFFLSRGRRTSRIVTSCARWPADELGVVVQELVKPVDDVHPRARWRRARRGARPARACRSTGAIPKMKSRGTCPASAMASPRSRQIGMPLGTPSSTSPASRPALLAVDDREDLVLLGVAHQAVGGLAVAGAEVRLAVDDRGAAELRRVREPDCLGVGQNARNRNVGTGTWDSSPGWRCSRAAAQRQLRTCACSPQLARATPTGAAAP